MNTTKSAALVTMVVAAAACGGGGGASSQDLVGTWNATRYELVSAANQATKVELITLGATVAVVFRADDTYQATIRAPGQPDQITTGTWSLSIDVLTMHEDGSSTTFQFGYGLSGGTLTLTGGGSEWDFDDDGTMEDARLNVTAVKQ